MIARGSPFGGGAFPILLLVILAVSLLTGGGAGPISGVIQNPTAFDAWIRFIGFVVAIGLGITFHEFMHAWTAHKNGDDTGRSFGRMSLDPRVHLDVLGTLLILFIGFGYGKPVPINEGRLRSGRLGVSLVSLAGPLTNFALAAIAAIPIRAGANDIFSGELGRAYQVILLSIVAYNCLLGTFNLIPIPPLDGSRVVYGLLPPRQAYAWRTYEQYGAFIILALFFLVPYFFHRNVLGELVERPATWLIGVLVGR